MGNGSGVSRGDRNRNARLARLRALVPVENAIVGIDLADAKQMVVVTDHDSKVLARRTFRCRAWDLGAALDWAAERAAAKGFAGVTVACEPTGHRWRVLGQLAADRSMPFVCVQPMVTSWARRAEDLTIDKTDEKDAVLIARLTAQLRCYVPEPVDETWARLRHLGARREQLITEIVESGPADAGSARMRLAGGVGLRAAAVPLEHVDRRAERDRRPRRRRSGPHPTPRPSPVRARGATPDHQAGWAETLPAHRRRKLFAALTDPAGVTAHRAGAMERVQLLLEDWQHAHRRLGRHRDPDDHRARRARTDRVWSPRSPASRAVGAAAILAETGDPRRFATARALVKHAGLAPREKLSGTFVGRTKLTGQGPARAAARGLACGLGSATRQPRLRRPLPTPDHPRAQQAPAHPSPDRHRRRDPAAPARRDHHRPSLGPDIATHGTRHGERTRARRLTAPVAAHQAGGRGEPYAA